MNRIGKFVILDFISIKPDLRIWDVLLYIALGIVGYLFMGVAGVAVGIAPLAANLAIYPFSAGDNGLDEFYASMFIDRKTVVVGRHVFGLVLSAISTVILFLIGLLMSIIMDDGTSMLGFAALLVGVFFITTAIDFINLPILFKMGFKKSRTFSTMLPMAFVVVLAAVIFIQGIDYTQVFTDMINEAGEILVYGGIEANMVALVLTAFALWLVMLFGSILLSYAFYRKRNF